MNIDVNRVTNHAACARGCSSRPVGSSVAGTIPAAGPTLSVLIRTASSYSAVPGQTTPSSICPPVSTGPIAQSAFSSGCVIRYGIAPYSRELWSMLPRS